MIITQTPLRISFVGGGTDLPVFYEYEEGSVISCTIDKYIYVIVKKRFDDLIRASYTNSEIVNSVNDLKHELIRESLKKTGIDNSIEIVTIADIPAEGTGLGSSSTLTVGLLNACYQYIGEPQSPIRLAIEACEIEMNRLKKPVGKQDQYIAALGGIRKITFLPDGEVRTTLLDIKSTVLKALSQNFMLFYTGITRKADNILSEQKNNTANKIQVLRLMKAMVDELEKELLHGNIEAMGEILHRGWHYKKQLASGITNSFIDDIYEKAIVSGATGGKITGAGGGGFLLLYVPIEKHAPVRKSLETLREVPFKIEPDGTKTLINTRRSDY